MGGHTHSDHSDLEQSKSKKGRNLGLSPLLPHLLPPPPITLASPAPQLPTPSPFSMSGPRNASRTPSHFHCWIGPSHRPGRHTAGFPEPQACTLFPSPQVPPPLWDTVPALPQAVSRFQARTWIMAAETACFFAQNQKPAVTLTLAQTKDQFLL